VEPTEHARDRDRLRPHAPTPCAARSNAGPNCRRDRQPLYRRVLPPLPRLICLRCHLRPRWDEYPPSDRPGFKPRSPWTMFG